MNDYKSISLIGGIYKIVSKIVANKLSKILVSIILETQSAFIGKRRILDGVVILNEAIDEAKKRHMEIIFFKIDFTKAYDSIECSFIDLLMSEFGFNPLWRKWIMECISNASASILINGSPMDEYKLERGLRQGDLLSLFLFLIATKGLSILMTRATELGFFEGAKIERNLICFSHLQFVDDTIFIGAESNANAWTMN